VACFSGDISLYATDDAAIDAMAEYALRRMPVIPRIISSKRVVDRFWLTLREAPYPVQFDRRQLVYTLEPQDLVAEPEPRLRLARPSEAEAVARLASAMSDEEIQMDPFRDHPLSYLRLIEQRIRLERYYVLEEGGEIKFQVHLNSITPYAGQITGVYTPKAHRRHGWAQRGMGAFCRLALERAPRLCLFVNDFNTPAIRLYERLGFRSVMEYRAVFMRAPL
jgi:ribosomal protein S18 acetylase RimI-like enzyme